MADSIASLIARGPGKVDFSALMNAPDAFAQGQQTGADYRSRQALKGGLPRTADGQIDFAAAADLLARTGNLGATMDAAKLATANNNNSFDRQYKQGVLEIARQNATRQEVPTDIKKLQAAGIKPGTPEAAKALFPRTDTPISATDKKAIFEAEDTLPQLQGTLEALGRAKEINSKTFSGVGAGLRATVGANLPDWMVPDVIADKQTANTTVEWQKIMGPEALQTMANTLKGATTDFELRQFIEMLGNPATPPEVRAKVIDRMMTLAQRKLELSQSRVKDLRGGTYFQPGQGARPQAASDPLQMARDAIAKGADPNAVRQRLQQNGIDPSGL